MSVVAMRKWAETLFSIRRPRRTAARAEQELAKAGWLVENAWVMQVQTLSVLGGSRFGIRLLHTRDDRIDSRSCQSGTCSPGARGGLS